MIRLLAGLFGLRTQQQASEVQPSVSTEDILLHSECFEAWLYEQVGPRSFDWKQLWLFLEQNSERLERELAWINHAKRSTEAEGQAEQGASISGTSGREILRHYKAAANEPQLYRLPEAPSCPFCGAREAQGCLICFGEYAK